jgi:hypothetical protein
VRNFADGFNKYASITHFLDGQYAAFSSGDIGKLYWGKVKSMQRNVLYLKPGTLLMIDSVTPANRDVDVSLLYQTLRLEDIKAGEKKSTINKDGNTLHIEHLYPEKSYVEKIETPHYYYTLLHEKPLEKEGLLSVSARTEGCTLIIANLLKSSAKGDTIDVKTARGEGFIRGTSGGTSFAFSTSSHVFYDFGDIHTDALAITAEDNVIFGAKCTKIEKAGSLLLESEECITCEFSPLGLKYCLEKDSTISLSVPASAEAVIVNGVKTTFTYDIVNKTATFKLPAGEGFIEY